MKQKRASKLQLAENTDDSFLSNFVHCQISEIIEFAQLECIVTNYLIFDFFCRFPLCMLHKFCRKCFSIMNEPHSSLPNAIVLTQNCARNKKSKNCGCNGKSHHQQMVVLKGWKTKLFVRFTTKIEVKGKANWQKYNSNVNVVKYFYDRNMKITLVLTKLTFRKEGVFKRSFFFA